MSFYLDLEKTSDEELVELALANQNDFSYIVRRYEDKLLRYIRRLSNVSLEEAEDVLQNIFIKVYLNLNDFDSSLKFSSWIYRLAHNEIIDNYRRLKARPQLSNIDINDSQIKELTDKTDLLAEAELISFKESILNAINQLDIKYKEIIILKFIEEKDYQEISDIIKKPMGTVASRINKAKKQLKKILQSKI